MRIKEINKIEDKAIATLFSGDAAQVHCRAIEIGTTTVTPINKEDATVTFKGAVEYQENGEGTGAYEVLNAVKFTKRMSELPTTDLGSAEIVEYFVDEVCGLHVPAMPDPDGLV